MTVPIDALLAAADNPVPVDPVQVGILIAAGVSILWAIREWVYGGSLLKVTFELGRTNGTTGIAVGPGDFADLKAAEYRLQMGVTGPAIDIVTITVRNKGRTPATILNPSLVFSAKGVEDTAIGGLLVGGEDSELQTRVRIEAHDTRVFRLLLTPLIATGLEQVEAQRPQGQTGDVWARATVTAGTGKQRLSPRWVRRRDGKRGIVDGRWTVRERLVSEPASFIETLLLDVFRPDVPLREQMAALDGAVWSAGAGATDQEIITMLRETYGPFQAAMITISIQKHLTEQKKPSPEPK